MDELLYLLKNSQIEIKKYDQDSSENRYEEFEFIPNLDTEDYETIKPAFVKGDRVICTPTGLHEGSNQKYALWLASIANP